MQNISMAIALLHVAEDAMECSLENWMSAFVAGHANASLIEGMHNLTCCNALLQHSRFCNFISRMPPSHTHFVPMS